MSVMVVLHTQRPPELCTSERPAHLPDYGAGRVCAVDGCGTILRRTHSGETCEQCSDNGREIKEGKMTTHSEDRERVLEFLRDRAGQELPRATVAEWLGLPRRAVGQHVGHAVAAGHDIAIAYPQPGKRGEPTYTYSSSDGSPPVAEPEPAPETETPAVPAPVAGPETDEPGIVDPRIEAAYPASSTWPPHVLVVTADPEVAAIETCTRALCELCVDARERVIAYLRHRYTDGML